MNTSTLRDTILKDLKREKGFKDMVSTNIDGFHFSAADIALPNVNGDTADVYRISVIKYAANEKALSV